jgi:hypothetical protein
MPTEIFFILVLHSIAAVITLIIALRDGLGFLQALRWGGLGFITGLLGLITRARMDRRHLDHMHVVQDALLNFGMEAVALYGIPHILR